jgi:hypothetical protein
MVRGRCCVCVCVRSVQCVCVCVWGGGGGGRGELLWCVHDMNERVFGALCPETRDSTVSRLLIRQGNVYTF